MQCRLCDSPNALEGTELCNRCWELSRRIKANPELARKILEENSKTKGFIIYCSTGCSCCSNENHYRGPFRTRTTAESRAAVYHSSRLLASQYAKNGRYEILEVEIEILADGRVVVDNTHVFPGFAEDGYDDKMWYYN